MDKIKNHISFFAFAIIALIICALTNGFENNTWIVSIISSIIGGFIVDYITPAIPEKLKKIRLTKEEKNKVLQSVKLEMRKIINRIHNNSSQALGTTQSLINKDNNNKDYQDIHLCLSNAQEDLDSLENYLKQG